MRTRKQKSGGQALVLVTLSLLAMAGIMGLAVDLGWSYFIEKEAQTAADGAALAAVQEGVTRIRGGTVSGVTTITAFTCASASTGSGGIDCKTTATSCASVTSTSNLNNGCQYAKTNGFDWTQSNITVTMQSNDGQTADLPTTAPGVKNLDYWVTARVSQSIPQLFSAVLGNNTGQVAALATAAIAASQSPGNLYGMNQAGDCWSLPSASGGTNCGADILNEATGSGSTCPGTAVSGGICAPAGIVIASNCNSTMSSSLCSSTKSSSDCSTPPCAADAGTVKVVANSVTVNGSGGQNGTLNNASNFVSTSGSTVSPTYTTTSSVFQDIYGKYGVSQPPLFGSATQSAIASCGIPSSIAASSQGLSGTLGAFQYYSYTNTNASGPIPDGGPIKLGTVTTTSSASQATCTALGGTWTSGATQANSSFPTYVFYGGVSDIGNGTLGAGQYVFAGVSSTTGTVLNTTGSINGDSTTGTMFITTDANYPGLSSQITNVPNYASMPTMYQGSVELKNSGMTLSGVVNSNVSGSSLPSGMNPWTGVAVWQDRRNSMVVYNKSSSTYCSASNCTGDDGSVIGCISGCSKISTIGSSTTADTLLGVIQGDNHVTSTSPHFDLAPGGANFQINGVIYQPRGAWMTLRHGNGTGQTSGALQIVTGSIETSTGNDAILLQGPTNPILSYKAVLIR